MEVFYLNKISFLKSVNRESLLKFSDNRNYKSEEKFLEHLCGLFLVKFLAKNIYKLEDTEIELIDKKPYFQNRKLYFSVSHSNEFVLVAFNKTDIGADIEYMQDRDYGRVLSRYGREIDCQTKLDFYKFWTKHEAQIKLGNPAKSCVTAFLNDDYAITCVCNDVMISDLKLKEVVLTSEDIDLTNEYNNPTNIGVLSS